MWCIPDWLLLLDSFPLTLSLPLDSLHPFSLAFLPYVPLPHIINTHHLKSTANHPPTVPLWNPSLQKPASLTCHWLERERPAAKGWREAFLELSITTGESHTLSDNQRKHSDLAHISIVAYYGFLSSLMHSTFSFYSIISPRNRWDANTDNTLICSESSCSAEHHQSSDNFKCNESCCSSLPVCVGVGSRVTKGV